MSLRFSILGCGNGGQTMAADLARRGFEVVALYDRFAEAVEPVRERRGVELVGELMQGFVPLTNVTTDLEAAVANADVIMIVVPSTAHAWVAEQLAPYVRPHHTIMLHPGYFGGSILFRRMLEERGAPRSCVVGEAHILIYATRIVGRGVVGVRGVKHWVQVAAFPAFDTPRLMEKVGTAFPQFVAAEHVLETGLNNPNPIIHTPVYLLNFARIEQGEAPVAFDFHGWMSPGDSGSKGFHTKRSTGAATGAAGARSFPSRDPFPRVPRAFPLGLSSRTSLWGWSLSRRLGAPCRSRLRRSTRR